MWSCVRSRTSTWVVQARACAGSGAIATAGATPAAASNSTHLPRSRILFIARSTSVVGLEVPVRGRNQGGVSRRAAEGPRLSGGYGDAGAERHAGELVAATEVLDVPRHPGFGLRWLAAAHRFRDATLRHDDA